MKNYYRILQISVTSSKNDIREAYKKLSKAYHPDVSKHPKGNEMMIEINEAYHTLYDETTRKTYDIEYTVWFEQEEKKHKKLVILKKNGLEIK